VFFFWGNKKCSSPSSRSGTLKVTAVRQMLHLKQTSCLCHLRLHSLVNEDYIFWTTTTCLLVICFGRFRGDYCVCSPSTTLKMEAADSSKSPIINNKSKLRPIPVDRTYPFSHLFNYFYFIYIILIIYVTTSSVFQNIRCLILWSMNNWGMDWNEVSLSSGCYFEA
jgi:hypothetical protein